MSLLRTCFVFLLVFSVVTVFRAQTALAQAVDQSKTPLPTADDLGQHWLSNLEFAAEVAVNSVRERVTGHASLYLLATPKDVEQGHVTVRALNILFTGVNQRLLAPDAQIQKPLGLLGFAVVVGKPQQLKYNPRSGRLTGKLLLYADASFLSAYARQEDDSKDDLFLTPTIPVTATIDLTLERPVSIRSIEPQKLLGRFDLKLESREFTYKQLKVPPLRLQMAEVHQVNWEIYPIIWFEVAQRLCVQPVRLLRTTWTSGLLPHLQIHMSGAGLAFGEPGARREWVKAGVVFTFLDWKTIGADSFWELASSEAGTLRATVEDDECIEIFFPYVLDPADLWGGGATFGSGTASAQIISSDGNARGGVDFTHLAHELGHVLGLRHPGAATTTSAVPASSGTLMCPSGYLNDNPRINSQQNEDLLSNPLLTFAIKRRLDVPDCSDSADCGSCP